MLRMNLIATIVMMLAVTGLCHGETEEAGGFFEQETLTNNWFGVGETLQEKGISVALGVTNTYQLNLRNSNTLTHRRSGRWTGSYTLEMEVDLDRLMGVPGLVYTSAGGSWSDGLDDSSIGSLFGVNSGAGGDRTIDLTQLYYELDLFEEALRIRLGKLDITGGFECRGCPVAFDSSMYAGDDSFQFLNGSLSNNPTIPFPDNGIGVVVYYQPLEWFYVCAGAADQQADVRTTGLNTAFHDEQYYFTIAETGVAPQIDSPNGPLQGIYRVGVWYDAPKDTLDGMATQDDIGFYVTVDQAAFRENQDDDQGLALFGRYGFANEDVSQVEHFWSIGAQYQGLIPSRDNDILGIGYSYGQLSNQGGFTENSEIVREIYYNIEVTPFLRITPGLQLINNAGGVDANATVASVRAQLTF